MTDRPFEGVDPHVADMPLRKASLYVEGGDAFWTSAMPHLLKAYPQITPDAFWNLTVAEASELWGFIHGE